MAAIYKENLMGRPRIYPIRTIRSRELPDALKSELEAAAHEREISVNQLTMEILECFCAIRRLAKLPVSHRGELELAAQSRKGDPL